MAEAEDAQSIERWIRAAYLTKGGVYLLLGALCVNAIVAGPAVPGAHGIGRALLVLGALGLAAYAVWRFMQGVLDFEHDGGGLRGLLRRGGYLLSGLLHGALAVAAVQLSASQSAAAATWIGDLHGHPTGLVVVGSIGVLLMASGVYQMLIGLTSTFIDRLQTARMSRRSVQLAALSGRVGVSGRGLVLLGLGAVLAHGTYGDGGMAAHSIIERLSRIAATPFGAFLLLCASLCLIAYGLHMLVWARYVEIRNTRQDDATPSHRLSAHAR